MEKITLRLPLWTIILATVISNIPLIQVLWNRHRALSRFPQLFPPEYHSVWHPGMTWLLVPVAFGVGVMLYWKLQVDGDEIIIRNFLKKTRRFEDILYAVEHRKVTTLYDENFKRIADVPQQCRNYAAFERVLTDKNVHFVEREYFKYQRKKHRAKIRGGV